MMGVLFPDWALLQKSAAVNFDDFFFLIAQSDSESYRDYKSYGLFPGCIKSIFNNIYTVPNHINH